MTAKSAVTPNQLKRWAFANFQAIRAMLEAQKHARAERVRVDAYIEPLFRAHRFLNESGEVIAKSKDLYRCDDDAACAAFYAECDAAHRAHGFTGADGECPALIAENQAIKAETKVIDSIGALMGFEGCTMSLEHRAKLLALITGMHEGR